jgi:peptidoglycan/xylan/chitin deacetylase (PgdA/CDA1 family)
MAVPVLIFHSLDDRATLTSFPPRVFEHGLVRLQAHGYRALDLMQVVDCLVQGQGLPSRAFVITFDDGYESVYNVAFPLLQRLGMAATVFLTVGERRSSDPKARLPARTGRVMLSWQQMREMQRHGIHFGAHTLTHPRLSELPLERVQHEICGSKAVIEDMLGIPVFAFAYPFGQHDARSRHVARQHFRCACADTLSLVTLESDPYALDRVDTFFARSDVLFALTATPWLGSYVSARRHLRDVRRMLSSWSEHRGGRWRKRRRGSEP